MTGSSTTSAAMFDSLVIGGGPAGLATALLLAKRGLHVGVLRPIESDPPQFARTTALMADSIHILAHLGVWERLADKAAPLRKMRMIDGRDRLLRAPTVSFDAAELGLAQFGFNIPNAPLVAALEGQAAETGNLTMIEGTAREIVSGDRTVRVGCADGRTLEARLIVGADGRNSFVRQIAGIKTLNWAYPQTALTVNLAHQADHHGISSEFHTATGPFTLVPLPGRESSLVAALAPEEAKRLLAMEADELAADLTRRSHHLLGRLTIVSKPAGFPLAGHAVTHFAKGRFALVGEAAHGFPPIGAQGLNLGLRDGLHLAECVLKGQDRSPDPAHPAVIAAYDAARRGDVWMRTAIVDMADRSLLAGLLPTDAARGLTLFAASTFSPLRRALMKGGIGPAASRHAMNRLGMASSRFAPNP